MSDKVNPSTPPVVPLWQAKDLEQILITHAILDVRRTDEYITGHIPNALHVPHNQVITRENEIKQFAGTKPLAVYCHAGIRSAYAVSNLLSLGIEAYSLEGGILSVDEQYLVID